MENNGGEGDEIMKKWIVLSVLLLMFGNVIFAEEYDFRSTRWGMTKEEVEKTETDTFKNDNFIATKDNKKAEKIVYETIINGYHCQIYYLFDEKNQLYDAGYIYRNSFADRHDYMNEILRLRLLLMNKYGQPTSQKNETIVWIYRNTEIKLVYFGPDSPALFVKLFTISYSDIRKQNNF